MATLNEIAQFCGTSPSTISKVMNGNDSRISAAKREEILAAVKQLQYRPAAHARSLARRRASMIGVVTVYVPHMLSFQYNTVLVGAILDEATNHQQTLALFNGRIWANEEQDQLIFADGRCDGFVVLDAGNIPGLIPALQRAGIPFVAVNSDPVPETVTSLDVDDVHVGYIATRHLIEHGHQRIAYLEQNPHALFSLKRFQGYEKALEEAGIGFDPALLVPGDSVANHAYQRVRNLVTSQPSVTALFCAHDAIALAAIQALKDMQLRVPEDFSVVGVNDIPGAACSVPALTTVSQNLEGLGVRATQILLELIEDPAQTARQIRWPVQLVERQSVAMARLP